MYLWIMKYSEAKEKFIHSWGSLATQWGINKTMAQIHALLMISNEPLSVEDIMDELQISRGNVSMNLRELMNWGIVFKEFKAGERKDFFVSEKDFDEMARRISVERSRREIKPIIRVLADVKEVEESTARAGYFEEKTGELHDLILKADQMIEKVTSQRGSWITKSLMRLLK